MSRFNVMPRDIQVPPLAPTDVAVIVVDSEGNYHAVAMTRRALELAQPPALHHVIRDLVDRLDEHR